MSEPSVNSKVRLLGEVGTTEKPSLSLTPRTPAQSAAPPVSITPPPPPAPVPAEPIFLGDSADGADLLNAGQIVQPLAQLCADRSGSDAFSGGDPGAVRGRQDIRAQAFRAGDRTAWRFVGDRRRRRPAPGRAGARRRLEPRRGAGGDRERRLCRARSGAGRGGLFGPPGRNRPCRRRSASRRESGVRPP